MQKGRLGESQQLTADRDFSEQLGPVGLLPGIEIIPADRNPHIHITEAVGLAPGKAPAQPQGVDVPALVQGSGGVGDGANLGQIRQAGQRGGRWWHVSGPLFGDGLYSAQLQDNKREDSSMKIGVTLFATDYAMRRTRLPGPVRNAALSRSGSRNIPISRPACGLRHRSAAQHHAIYGICTICLSPLPPPPPRPQRSSSAAGSVW